MIDGTDDDLLDSDDSSEGFGYYGIEMRIESGLIPEEEHDFIDKFKGKICYYADFSDSVPAGSFQATVVRSEDAGVSGIALYDLWDFSSDLHECYHALFDARKAEFKRSIERRFEAFNRDVLVLDKIVILPSHRGKNLGLAVASRLIDVLGRGCDLVVCLPGPMQFGSMPQLDPVQAKELALEAFDADEDRAFAKLRRYWSQLGFQRIGRNSDYYALSMNRVRPRIKEFCRRL